MLSDSKALVRSAVSLRPRAKPLAQRSTWHCISLNDDGIVSPALCKIHALFCGEEVVYYGVGSVTAPDEVRLARPVGPARVLGEGMPT